MAVTRLATPTLVLATIAAACGEPSHEPFGPDPLLHHNPRHGSGSEDGGDIPLTVTFRDGAALPDRVTSDGGGDYLDGVDRVEALLAGSGQFVFDAETDRGRPPATPRTVCVDFGDRADADDPGTEDDPPFLHACVEAKWNVTDVPGGIGNMAAGETLTGQSRLLWVADDINYKVLWGDRDVDHPDDPNQVFVTRLDADTWTLKATSEQVAVLVTLPTSGNAGETVVGEWHMPFHLELGRK